MNAQIDIPIERNQFIEELKQIEKDRRPSDDSRVQMSTENQAKWFYIDDFFIWLGCKFVTCDKDAKKDEPDNKPKPEEAKNKDMTMKDVQKMKEPVVKVISQNEVAMREAAAATAQKIKIQMDKEEQSRAELREKKRIIDEDKANKKAAQDAKDNTVVSLRPVEAVASVATMSQDKPQAAVQPAAQSVKDKQLIDQKKLQADQKQKQSNTLVTTAHKEVIKAVATPVPVKVVSAPVPVKAVITPVKAVAAPVKAVAKPVKAVAAPVAAVAKPVTMPATKK